MRANKLRVEDKSNRVRCREYKFYEKNFGLKTNQSECVAEDLSVMKEKRGCSSAGRAPALQAGGRQFDSVHLHQKLKL